MFILTLTLVTIFHSVQASVITINSTSSSTPTADLLDDNKERIIGGEPAIDGDLKYQLSLRFHYFHHCGASLIQVDDVQLAVTAAHCTEHYQSADEFALVAGDVRLSDKSGKEQARKVTKIVNHEEYDPDIISNDISLVFFDTPFILNDWVGVIPLPEQGQETKGTVIVSGWGVYNYQGVYSDNLTKLEVPVVDDELCKKAYAPLEYEYFDHFICAGYLGIGVYKDSCRGDSGGPVKSVEHGYLAGIVSWSEGCAHPRFPGVNTEVSHFIDWIEEEVNKHKDKDKKRERDQPSSDQKPVIKKKPKPAIPKFRVHQRYKVQSRPYIK